MKKSIITSLFALFTILASYAQLGGDGYYRVRNATTGRYIYVIDNKGSISYAATTADMNAIELWKGAEKAASDPASVLYIEKHGDGYDIRTQGTGLYQMIETYVKLRKVPNATDGSYWAYGSSNGLTKYLCDETPYYLPDPCRLSDNGSSGKNWFILPIDTNSDNYFGAKPTLAASDGYYLPFYADFPFTLPADIKAMYVTAYDAEQGIAIYKEIEGTVPGRTPVILKCSSNDPTLNRLTFVVSGEGAPADNLLRGVFFCNEVTGFHNNVTPHNPTTMRTLGVLSDGKIGLVKGNYTNVPRNTFYLPVTASCPDQLKLMTQKEYETGIADVMADSAADAPIYNLMGVMVRCAGGFADLAPGVYVQGGKKFIVR